MLPQLGLKAAERRASQPAPQDGRTADAQCRFLDTGFWNRYQNEQMV